MTQASINILERLEKIKAFVFDIDGVLTDGSIWVFEDNKLIRQMNIKDGYALHLAVIKKYPIAIISGGNSEEVKERLGKLNITDVYLRVPHKLTALKEWLLIHNINEKEVLYMGDDMPDLECIKYVGVGACPLDACTEIKEASNYISSYKGGEGCVRDAIEKVLKLQDNWE